VSLDESGLPGDARNSGDDSTEKGTAKRGNKPEKNSEDAKDLARLYARFASEGQTYVEIHNRLVTYFECNGCLDSGHLADLVFKVLARKLKTETIRKVVQYCIGIARQVLRDEWRRQRNLDHIEDNVMGEGGFPDGIDHEEQIVEKIDGDRRRVCLQRCLRALKPEERNMILQFHGADDAQQISERKGPAKAVGPKEGTLRVQAFRIRKQLKSCATECMQSMAEARANLKRRY